MDRRTVDVYEEQAAVWKAQRAPVHMAAPEQLRAAVPDGLVADLGCGPGWYAARMAPHAIALDAARAMLDLVPDVAPGVPRVQADLAHLPFRRGGLDGVLALRSYVHLPRTDVPLALGDLHRTVAVGGTVRLTVFSGDQELAAFRRDDFADGRRRFSAWPPELFVHVLTGAGFDVQEVTSAGPPSQNLDVVATRARTIADTVGPDMRLLVCGLNPSVYAADAGVGFARPGNRFWAAARSAGLVSRDRDPLGALLDHRIGMTDVVKRATARADELAPDEYRRGFERLDALCGWLQPGAICFVGLAGWRAVVARTAVAGPQARPVGGRPVYLMPSTSGLNARTPPTELARHLRAAAALADAEQ